MSASSSAFALNWMWPVPSLRVVLHLPADLRQHGALEQLRRGQDLRVAASGRVTGGEVVEQLHQIAADRLVARQQPEVVVEPCGPRVVVAGAHVRVQAQPVEVLAHHENHLAVGLQSHHAVGDVDPRLLQAARPPDVRRLVETRLQLDHHRDLLAVAGRVEQIVEDLRLARGPVQRHLDRAHLRVAARLGHEALHRVRERFVRMLQEDGAGVADRVEDAALVDEGTVVDGVVGRIAQRRELERRNLEQVPHGEHGLRLEDVLVRVQAQLGREPAPAVGIHAALDLHPDDGRETALAHLGLDHREQIVGDVRLAGEVRVAGDVEGLAGLDVHAREEEVEVARDHLLQRDEPVAARRCAGSAGARRRSAP